MVWLGLRLAHPNHPLRPPWKTNALFPGVDYYTFTIFLLFPLILSVSNPVLRQLYDTYSFQMIPVMGQVIAGDWNSYQYLVESIRTFPDQDSFKHMIEDAGFRMVR